MIRDQVDSCFGSGTSFVDRHGIEVGAEAQSLILRTLEYAAVLLLVIEPEWRRPVRDAKDWIFQELRHAKEHNVPVVPVLFGGSALPRKGELPEECWTLYELQPIVLDNARLEDGTVLLLERLFGFVDIRTASLRRRGMARLLDVAIWALGSTALATYWIPADQRSSEYLGELLLFAMFFERELHLVWLALVVLYEVVSTVSAGGTVGKRLLGLEIVDYQGLKPSIGQLLIRSVVLCLPVVAFLFVANVIYASIVLMVVLGEIVVRDEMMVDRVGPSTPWDRISGLTVR